MTAEPLLDRCRDLVAEIGLAEPGDVRAATPLTGGVASDIALVDLGARDVVTTLVPFRPLRHVRSLRGPLDDILRAAPSDDFIKVILTDATPHIEPMKRLRRVFPNACQLSYARDERALATTTPAMVQTLLDDPIAVTDAFLKTLRDVGLAPAERKLVEGAIDALRRAGDAP